MARNLLLQRRTVFIKASRAIKRVLPSQAIRFRGVSVCVAATANVSWSPGPTRGTVVPRAWSSEPGTGADHRTTRRRQRQRAPQPAPTVRTHARSHLREPPNEASATLRRRTAAADQWEDGLAVEAGPSWRPRPRVRRAGAEPDSRQVVPGVREAGRTGRGGEGAAGGRQAQAARAGGSRRGARPPAGAPGGGHCAAPLSAVRARSAYRASSTPARPACSGPTCGGRRGRGAPSAAEPHEQ